MTPTKTVRRTRLAALALLAGALAGSGCREGSKAAADAAEHSKDVERYVGRASYYAERFNGRTTASGEAYDSTQMTAAHRELPMGTRVRVTNPENHRSVVVRINDRGPYADDRLIDLSRAAAEKLRMLDAGHVRVRVEVLERPEE